MLSLAHLVIVENKEVPKTKRWEDVQGHGNQRERAPSGQGWNNLSKIANVLLHYNPKCKINIYESILIEIHD